MAGLKLPKFKAMSIEQEVFTFLNPKFVYIPLISGNDTNLTVLTKKGEYVKKGEIIAKRKGNFRIPIHSSVSGKVIDFVEKTYLTGEKVKCVVIENDFKEQVEKEYEPKKLISTYTKEEFLTLLQENGVIGMGGAGFPTYVKYDCKEKINTLIVNAVECEPYVTADYMVIQKYCESILEAVDAILEINGIDEAMIAIKKTNTELKEIFDRYIGTYLKVKIVLVPDIYPMGWERTLVRQVKHVEYRTLPIEKGIVVNNISTIYAIYEALKYNKPVMERFVTFSGDGLKNPRNVFLKVGTSAFEVLEKLEINAREYTIVAGGPMMGDAILDEELVITPNLNCVLVLKKGIENVETTCLRCGKCVEVCPAKMSPVLIHDHLSDKEYLSSLHPEKCVECGLCSYVCPAKIHIRESVREAKKILRERVK